MILRKLRTLVLAACMVLSAAPSLTVPVHAVSDDAIGTIIRKGKVKEYTSLDKLLDDVEDYDDETFTINMLCDWIGGRIKIPEDSNVTLNMHGFVLNRNLSSDKYNGEAILLNGDATLTINGGPKYKHEVAVFSSNKLSGKRDKIIEVYGGVITGGYSCNGGGGIDMYSDCKLILNDVTIAGNRAEQFLQLDGYGGGIWVHGGINEAGTIIMNNSTITGNYAYNDGGGIYQTNHDNFILEMHNSHIDANYCEDEGGGICIDGESIMIRGDGKSSVSYNHNGCSSDDNGGGIYIWNDDVTVSGLEIIGNHGGVGGGIYSMEETISISNCVIEDNVSSKKGGGIYVENDGTTINNCIIQNNTAGGNGGGVYIASDVDEGLYITGKTVIKDNSNSNLYVGKDSNINFALTRGSEVYMQYDSPPGNSRRVSEKGVKGPNCIRFLHSDVPGYHFTYNSSPSQRRIYYVKDGYESADIGQAYTPAEAITISAQEADAAAETAVDGAAVTGNHDQGQTEYSLYRPYFEFPAMDADKTDLNAVFYYSDGFFDTDPAEYSDQLATLSTTMAMSGMYMSEPDYPYKHCSARQFLADIGVDEQTIHVNEYNIQKPGTDTIGVAIGYKQIKDKQGNETGKILIPIMVRGGGYEAEWTSNVTVGQWNERSGESLGFCQAADIVQSEVEKYLDKYNLRGELQAGNVKFWIAGFSRAGATSNLTAKRLIEHYACSDSAGENNEVFAYCIEAPKGGTDEAEELSDKTKYYSIHNVINYGDIVPLVAPFDFGVKRYGVDHYIPGTQAGQVTSRSEDTYRADGLHLQNKTTVTTYADNEPIITKANGKDNPAYISLRTDMEKHLRSVNSTLVFDDYFHLMELYLLTGISIEEQGSYSVTEESFIRTFIDDLVDWTVENRYNWSGKVIRLSGTEYVSMQQALRETCALLFSMSPEDLEGFINKVSALPFNISTLSISEKSLFDVWNKVVNGWGPLSDSGKKSYLTFFWKKIKETGALDYLPQEEVGRLEKNLPTILYYVFNFVFSDNASSYETCGTFDSLIRTGTMAANASKIILNHYPEVDLSWFRTQDKYYNGELFDERDKEYTVTDRESLSAPTAYVIKESADGGEDEIVDMEPRLDEKFLGSQKVFLDVKDVKGEIIYYSVENQDTGEKIVDNQLYRGGIPLHYDDSRLASYYKITATARSRGTQSKEERYYVKLVGGNHLINYQGIRDGEDGKEIVKETYMYKAGEEVCIAADIPTDKFFTGWNLHDDQGRDISDRLVSDESDLTKPVLQFTMPEPDTDGYSTDYYLYVSAEYGDKISVLNLSPRLINDTEGGLPAAGEPLAHHLHGEWNGDNGGEGNFGYLYWYYYNEGRKILARENDNAFNNAVYVLDVRIPQNEDMQFMEDLEVHIEGVPDENIDVVRNSADGSLSLHVEFEETGDAGEEFEPALDNVTKIVMEPWDTNLDAPAGETEELYISRPQTVTLHPMVIQDEVFTGWVHDDDDEVHWRATSLDRAELEIGRNAPDEIMIRLEYVPVVNKIEFEIGEGPDWAPAAGESGEDIKINHVYITVTDRYEMDVNYNNKDFFELKWSPALKWNKTVRPYYQMFDYNKTYTATVHYKQGYANEMAHITNTETGEDFEISRGFVYAEDLEVYINGKRAAFNKSKLDAYYTFPATESKTKTVVSVDQPLDITDVSFGADEDEIRGMLWPTTVVEAADFYTAEVDIDWTGLERLSGDDEFGSASVWKATGEVILPENITNDNNVNLTVTQTVYVNAAQFATAPDASPQSGSYLSDIVVMLSTDTEGGVIHYTTDGSPADADSPVYSDEEPILITREMAAEQEDGTVVVRAITTADDMFDSTEAYFTYSFTNEISVPKGNTLMYNTRTQIGQEVNKYFTLTADADSGVTFDEKGNALVKDAGTYEVTAHINDGYQWKIRQTVTDTETAYELVEVDGEIVEQEVERTVERIEEVTTTEDQKITIVVNKADLDYLSAAAEDMVYTGQPLTPPVILSYGDALVSSDEYTVTYDNNTEIGTASYTITANEINFTGTKTGEFEIAESLDDGRPQFKGHQLVLSGTLGMRFGVQFPEGFDTEGSYMEFIVRDQIQRVSSEEAMEAGNNRLIYTCYVNSLQMAETINAVFHYGDNKIITQEYTVETYLDYLAEQDPEDNPDGIDEKTVTLAKAINDYGFYAQIYLAKVHGFSLGEGGKYAKMKKYYTSTYDYAAILEEVTPYRFVKNLGDANLTRAAYKLSLDSDTALSISFIPEEGTEVTASADYYGETYNAAKQSDGSYLIRIEGIPASRLGTMIDAAGDADGEFSVSVSALSYVRSVLNSTSFNGMAKNAVSALYKYYEAVREYNS